MADKAGAKGTTGSTHKKDEDREKLIRELKKEDLVLKEALQDSREEPEVRAEELEARLEELRANNEELERQIAERKRAEEAAKKSRFILAKSQEMAHVGNWAWDVRTGELDGSDEAYRIYGYGPSEVRPDEGWALARAHPDDRALLRSFFSAVKREGTRKSVDHRIVRRDGAVRHVATVADKVVRDRAGNVVRVYGITQDITDRKRADAEASQLAAIVASSDDAVIGKTPDGVITSWNRGAEAMYGFTAEEAIGKPIDLIVPPEGRQELRDILGRIKHGERVDHHDTVRMCRDGRRLDVSVTISPIIDAAGRIAGASTIARDITDRKRAEAALQEKQEELEAQAEEMELQAEELRVNNEELERQITERKRAEAELLEKERQLSEAQALTRTGSWEMDLATGDVSFSDEMSRILGLPPGRHAYADFRDCVHPEDRAYREASIRDAIAGNKPYVVDYRIVRADGGVRSLRAVGRTGIGRDGKACRFISTVQDVTELRRAEAALRESEARSKVAEAVDAERKRFLDVLETIPAMVCLLTPDYHVAFANRSFREKFGESGGRHCYEYCYGRTGPCEFCESFVPLKTGSPHHWEVHNPDGTAIEAHDMPFTDVDGSPMILEMDIDITERKRAEMAFRELNETLERRVTKRTAELQEKQEELEAQAEEMEAQTEELRANNEELEEQIMERRRAEEVLRETSDYLENLINYANAPIIVWGPDSRITRFNHAFERLTGYAAKEMVGRKLDKLFPSESTEESLAKIKRTLAGEHWESVEIPILRKDGSTRIALWNSANIHAVDGRTLVATIAQGQDITERKRAEEAIRETSNYLESLINYANAPIIVWDPNFRVTRFNHAFERLTGHEAEEIVGRDLDILFPQESKEESLAKIKRTLAGEHWESVEIPILRKDGHTRIALWNSANIHSQDGRILVATIAQGQDITERKRAEKELSEAKNQAELYLDLMGHDISNMHQIALSQLELAQETMAEDGRLSGDDKELIDTPIDTLQRSATLIGNVRKLQKLRAGEYKAETLDLGVLLADVAEEYSGVPESSVVINYTPADGCYVEANPLLKDVFANLVGNAVKHSSGSAMINIRVDDVSEDKAYYRVAIEDNGPGIPDEKKSEVFHRFKRGQTKARGTGLGLYIVRTLVDSFHGRVMVEDRVPRDHTKGCRFVVLLPAAERPPASGTTPDNRNY